MVLEADPACWESPPAAPTVEDATREPLRPRVPPPASAFFDDFLGRQPGHQPLLLGTAAGVVLDLGTLRHSKNVHISIAAERLALDDLRLAYRWGNLAL